MALTLTSFPLRVVVVAAQGLVCMPSSAIGVWCGVVWCGVVRCMLRCGVVWCSVVLCSVVWLLRCRMLRCGVVWLLKFVCCA